MGFARPRPAPAARPVAVGVVETAHLNRREPPRGCPRKNPLLMERTVL